VLGRRLLLLVAVLLATGAIAAALTPRELRDSAPTTSTGTTATTTPRATGGTPGVARDVTRTVDASAPEESVVRVRVGDFLHLAVRAPSPDVAELVGTGRFATVDPSTPARFDFLVDREGTFPIRLQESGHDLGRVVATRA
jgi:hypothetical protein